MTPIKFLNYFNLVVATVFLLITILRLLFYCGTYFLESKPKKILGNNRWHPRTSASVVRSYLRGSRVPIILSVTDRPCSFYRQHCFSRSSPIVGVIIPITSTDTRTGARVARNYLRGSLVLTIMSFSDWTWPHILTLTLFQPIIISVAVITSIPSTYT